MYILHTRLPTYWDHGFDTGYATGHDLTSNSRIFNAVSILILAQMSVDWIMG